MAFRRDVVSFTFNQRKLSGEALKADEKPWEFDHFGGHSVVNENLIVPLLFLMVSEEQRGRA